MFHYRISESEMKFTTFGKRLVLQFTKSQRGHPILEYNGYRFRKERQLANGKEYWRCLRVKCKARIILERDVILKYSDHSICQVEEQPVDTKFVYNKFTKQQ